jgi:hypothetical protein
MRRETKRQTEAEHGFQHFKFSFEKSLGKHRFQRAGSAKDLLIGIRRPRTGSDPYQAFVSYKFVFFRDCTLEAMRTQGRFSLIQGLAHCRMNDSFKGKSRNVVASLRAVI